MVEFPLLLAVGDETLEDLGRRSAEVCRGQQFLLEEVVEVDLADSRLHRFVEPVPKFCGRRLASELHKRLGLPANPSVPLADLHDRAPERPDPDHGVILPCTIADDEGH